MRAYGLNHLSDRDLLRDLAALLSQERVTIATVLAHLAEVDARKLYVPIGYPSMFAYCVHELHLSEDAAAKRIQVARVARRFPVVFEAVAAGRLHLSGVVLLAPHLTEENLDELLAGAAHQSKAEIERIVAARFPRPEVTAMVRRIPTRPASDAVSSLPAAASREPMVTEHAPGHIERVVEPPHVEHQVVEPPRAETPVSRAKLAPVSAERFALQVTIGESTHRKLRYAQDLLGHRIPSRDLAQVLDHALDALVRELEKSKFAATDRPRRSRECAEAGKRHVPAAVRRAVWERDGAQCTYVSDAGRRCPARTFLEFDHMDEVARGGKATVERMRLRCRAHNQYAAECAFGFGFMNDKRQAARAATGGKPTNRAGRVVSSSAIGCPQ